MHRCPPVGIGLVVCPRVSFQHPGCPRYKGVGLGYGRERGGVRRCGRGGQKAWACGQRACARGGKRLGCVCTILDRCIELRWGEGWWDVSGFGVPFPIFDCVVKLCRGQKIPNFVLEVGSGIVPRISLEIDVSAWKWGPARRCNGGGRESVRG